MQGTIAEYKMYVRNETRSLATIRIRDHYIDLLAKTLDPRTATETDIETWLRSHGWAPTSMNSALASLRHFYKWATRYGKTTHNPALHIRRTAAPRKVSRIASDERIVAAMMKAPVDTRVMIMLGAECGLRRAEIAKVHRADIDGEWLYVVGKGGHQRVMYLSDELQELIALLPHDGYLFPGQDHGHLSADSVYRRVKRITGGLNTHSLRHRAGTAVFEGTGNNLRVAQEFLGHANIATTQKYVHVTRGDLVRAAEAAKITRTASAA